MDVIIQPATGLRGRIQPPGDKSLAHRALILGCLADGDQVVRNLPGSADVRSTLSCLGDLGCQIDTLQDGSLSIRSAKWRDPVSLDAGNSGTTTRLLAGLVAGLPLTCTLDGDASLRRRPMNRIAQPLTAMGAEVISSNAGCLPLKIKGGQLSGIHHRPSVASAQVKSAILIAGLQAGGQTTVEEIAQSRDHTERMLTAMGVTVACAGLAVTVQGGQTLHPVEMTLPGDISSAAFFLGAAAMVPGAELRLIATGINPTRTGFLNVLEQMGASVDLDEVHEHHGEPVADILARGGVLQGVEIGGSLVPRLIDELPLLAVLATQAEGTTVVRDAAELRHKETDRIAAVVGALQTLGADITEQEDGFRVNGPTILKAASVSASGDHRIAMAMAVAGLVAAGPVRITGSEVVSVSYPQFFDDLGTVVT